MDKFKKAGRYDLKKHDEQTFRDLFLLYLDKGEDNLPDLDHTTKERFLRIIGAKNYIKARPILTVTELANYIGKEYSVSHKIAFYDAKEAMAAVGYDYKENKNFWKEAIIHGIFRTIAREEKKTNPDEKILLKAWETIADVVGVTRDTGDAMNKSDYGTKNIVNFIRMGDNIHVQKLDDIQQVHDAGTVEAILEEMIDQQMIILPEEPEHEEIPDAGDSI